jgi:hypothetical protein
MQDPLVSSFPLVAGNTRTFDFNLFLPTRSTFLPKLVLLVLFFLLLSFLLSLFLGAGETGEGKCGFLQRRKKRIFLSLSAISSRGVLMVYTPNIKVWGGIGILFRDA